MNALARLQPVVTSALPVSPEGYGSLAIGKSGRTLVWGTEWEKECDLVFVDLVTGEVQRRVREVAANGLVARPSGFFVADAGHRRGRAEEPSRLLELGEDGTVLRVVPMDGRGSLQSVSPDGASVAFFADRHLVIRTWPDMHERASLAGLRPRIEWQSERMFCWDGARYEVRSIAGDAAVIRIDTLEPIYPAAKGVASSSLSGLVLYGLRTPWTRRLTASSDKRISESVGDGGTVRACVGQTLHRFVVNLRSGELLHSTSVELPHDPFAPGGYDDRVFWHPKLDALLVHQRDRYWLCSVDGSKLLELPDDARPEAWFDDGRALLVTYPNANDQLLPFEVWRSKDG